MNFMSKRCKNLVPYVCGEQPQDKKYIKLNTNENPYPPSKKIEEILKQEDISLLRLYPDPENKALKNALAKRYCLERKNVFVGNGSDEILSFIFYAFFNENGNEEEEKSIACSGCESTSCQRSKDIAPNGVGFFDITYSFYPVYADFYNIKKNVVPLEDDFSASLERLDDTNSEGFIICNPNAPTGMEIPREALEAFIDKNKDKIVVVDEAYVAFANSSAVPLVKKYGNLLVVKTFSKAYSLAGLRCGYALGCENLIEALDRVKNSVNSYTVNRLTEKLAIVAIEDEEYNKLVVNRIINTREKTIKSLLAMGFKVLESHSNFLFIESEKIAGRELYLRLKERGILVRHFNKERIENFIRVTIGTDDEMNTFILVLKQIMST